MLKKFVRLKNNHFYLLPSGALCRINKVDHVRNKVLYYDYITKVNDVCSVDTAEQMMSPVWKIGAVGRMLNKAPSTLRKYERQGLVTGPSRFTIGYGQKPVRFYSENDVRQLIKFFRERNPVGRPSKTNISFGVDEESINRKIKSAYKKEK